MTFEFSEISLSSKQQTIVQDPSAIVRGEFELFQTQNNPVGLSYNSDELLTFALIDANSNEIVAGFEDMEAQGSTDLFTGSSSRFNIVGFVNPDHEDANKVQSIEFKSGFGQQVENLAPFALFGDHKGKVRGRKLTGGDFTVEATAFTGKKGTGQSLDTLQLNYSVMDIPEAPPNPPVLPPVDPPVATPVDPPITTPVDPPVVPPVTPPVIPPVINEPAPEIPDNVLISDFDHIISQFDGNVNDIDDVAAMPVVALLTNAIGKEAQSTFFYNNNLGEKSIPDRVRSMRSSAEFVEKLGIETHDYGANSAQATDALVDILNSGQKVLSLEGGPMEAIYRALQQVAPRNHQNITLVSHGRWNEDRDVVTVPGLRFVRTWDDIRRDFPNVNLVEISNQNGPDKSGPQGLYSSKWNWLDNVSNPVLKEARSKMLNAKRKKNVQLQKINDASDAGMLFYAITGNEEGDPLDVKEFLEKNTPTFA